MSEASSAELVNPASIVMAIVPAMEAAIRRFAVFFFMCFLLLHYVWFSGYFLPQSDFRDLFTDPVADYNEHQSYHTLDQTDRRCISKLPGLDTHTQDVYVKGISQRHVTRCTQQPYLFYTGRKQSAYSHDKQKTDRSRIPGSVICHIFFSFPQPSISAASYKVRSTELIAARYMMESHPIFLHKSMENRIL